MGNPWSRRAETIKNTALNLGLNFCRYELIGHGTDQKDFSRCDFELWKEQLEDVIIRQISTPIIIVGHCVGGWLGMCLTEKYPNRIKAFLSLAACPDLIEQKLRTSTPEQRQTLAEKEWLKPLSKNTVILFLNVCGPVCTKMTCCKIFGRHQLPYPPSPRTKRQFHWLDCCSKAVGKN